ncbi:tRNA 2-thiouridine synthesizing protein A [Nitrospirillum amazonense]|uniref:tRNA 2-thiouridine synthesizing protein A n=1 Tax=Nitrospirillum amazonense TaxID=28077 RepID=A0A560F0Z3_9PROT|nr:sulfurtransferase TusA family protein [Nitrospirillum amazonense]TWB15155.1 tRNA 2-thiouridine synthesizing protein A [Nitrospirillum amazonense]
MSGDRSLDAKGLVCPLPVLRARKALMAMTPGDILTLLATDQAARRDVPAFCQSAGHALLSADEVDGVLTFTIRRAGPA